MYPVIAYPNKALCNKSRSNEKIVTEMYDGQTKVNQLPPFL